MGPVLTKHGFSEVRLIYVNISRFIYIIYFKVKFLKFFSFGFQVDLTFARELSFYLVTIYIPCFMIVLVSWFSFWLDYKAVPARVALGVTTLLAMSTTMGSIQRSLPPVAYTKAVDVWSGVCVFFVFSALLEYALVNYASRLEEKKDGGPLNDTDS